MGLIVLTLVSISLAAFFLILWLRERKHASEAEVVAYGLRAQDDSDDNTKTSISAMESEYNEAVEKLQELGELHQDEWGRWIWDKTGKQLGSEREKKS